MKPITLEQVIKRLQKECIPAPLTVRKIIKVFEYDATIMHQVLDMFHSGLLVNYHMIPGNGSMEF